MKNSKNTKLLIRAILIPAILFFVIFTFLKLPSLLKWLEKESSATLPAVKTFGIPMPAGYTVHGIDVSRHQGTIYWERVSRMKKNGISISFVFIKATEGITRNDTKFDRNWSGAKKYGILRGAYHFYYPSRDADKQAENFIKHVKLTKGDLPPVVDIEISNGQSSSEIRKGLQKMLDRLEDNYSMKPIIYTNINFYNTHLAEKFDEYPLWIAGYFDQDRFQNEFETHWNFWQHSEKGKVDGIKGSVDFNVFHSDRTKLLKLTKR